ISSPMPGFSPQSSEQRKRLDFFDVAPLIPTSINELARLDEKSVRDASPLLWPSPPKGRTLVAAVGGDESPEFLRQSRVIAETWRAAGLTAEYLVVPGTNHFTVVDELNKPGSALFAAVARLARERSGHDGSTAL